MQLLILVTHGLGFLTCDLRVKLPDPQHFRTSRGVTVPLFPPTPLGFLSHWPRKGKKLSTGFSVSQTCGLAPQPPVPTMEPAWTSRRASTNAPAPLASLERTARTRMGPA